MSASDTVETPETVFVVDDDHDVLESLSMLLEANGLRVRAFSSPTVFLDALRGDETGCLLLDVRMPALDGLSLQGTLQERGVELPIVFISGHGDIPMAIRAVQAGALDFLEKPFTEEVLLERVHSALAADRTRRQTKQGHRELEHRLQRLTAREREVLEGLLAGKLNKVIAYDLDLSVRTVEVHRARVLEKLGVRNAQELVRTVLSSPAYRDWLL